jgi:hypothetical protein
VERLTTVIATEAGQDAPFSSVERLCVFTDMSRKDHEQTMGATSLLAEVLDSPSPVVDGVASLALSTLDLTGPIKRTVAEFGMGRR